MSSMAASIPVAPPPDLVQELKAACSLLSWQEVTDDMIRAVVATTAEAQRSAPELGAPP